MPKAKHYARIAITLPEKDLESADRLARKLDRSRSWVIAEAVRRLADQQDAGVSTVSARVGAARAAESRAEYAIAQVAGLGPLRLEQLRQDMKLTPEQRVREAEETLRLDAIVARRDRKPRIDRVLTFARLEDYVDWKRGQDRLP